MMSNAFKWCGTIGLIFFMLGCNGDDVAAEAGTDSATQADCCLPDATGMPDADVPDVGTARLILEPAEVEFGLAGIGTMQRRDVAVTNDGDRDVQVIALSGLSAPYSTSRTLPARIPAGGRRTFVFTFQPTDVGEFSQTVQFQTDIEGVEASLTLQGQVATADGRLASSDINFGRIEPGESRSEFLTLENLSEAGPITVNQIIGLEEPFSVAPGQLPTRAEASQSAQVVLNFAPTVEGEYDQMITVNTTAGDFQARLIGRALVAGDLSVRGVSPAWAPVDQDVRIEIVGGPFQAEAELEVSVGDRALVNLERMSEERIEGTLPRSLMATVGTQDIRVRVGERFGFLQDAFVMTRPVDEGSVLDATAIVDEIGPEGNPWRLVASLVVPAEETFRVRAGTVIIATEQNQGLTIVGAAEIGARDGVVVFSNQARAARSEAMPEGGWVGLRFEEGMAPATVQNTTIEYAGGVDEGAVSVVGRFVSFEGLTVQGRHHLSIDYRGATSASLVGARFANVDNTAIRLGDSVTISQLARVWTRAPVPVDANVRAFGRLPIGAEHDWGTDHAGIQLRGTTGTMRLANQPNGVYYTIGDVSVGAVDTFQVAPSVPLRFTGQLDVAGTLAITGGGRLDAGDAGLLALSASGVLSLTASADNRLVFGPEVADDSYSWLGVRVDGRIDGGHLTIRRGGLELNNDFGGLEGIHLESAQQPLRIAGSGTMTALQFDSETAGLEIYSGAGSIAGQINSGADFDVVFDTPELCAAWALDGLLRQDGEALRTNCP